MMAGPEVSRMVEEFDQTNDNMTARHHEQALGVQRTFAKEIAALIQAIIEMGNPFKEDSGDLSTLDSNEIMGY